MMERKNPPCRGGDADPNDCNPRSLYGLEGKSLAMVYSPKQYWRMLYTPEEGMTHGTLFEELYKPIMTANGTGGTTE